MVGLIIFITFGIIFFHIMIVWVKICEDQLDADKEYYEYCENCKYGFCMEEPRSVDCQKWKDEHEKTPS